jgi:hypothetical protein
MQSPSTKPIREDMQQRIEQFAGQVVTDLAAAMAGVMTNLGHKLGLYRAMAESGPINSDELARRGPEKRCGELRPSALGHSLYLFDKVVKGADRATHSE